MCIGRIRGPLPEDSIWPPEIPPERSPVFKKVYNISTNKKPVGRKKQGGEDRNRTHELGVTDQWYLKLAGRVFWDEMKMRSFSGPIELTFKCDSDHPIAKENDGETKVTHNVFSTCTFPKKKKMQN